MKLIKKAIKSLPFYNFVYGISQYETDRSNKLIYIHIGKCGGSSLWGAIKESTIIKKKFKSTRKVHITKPPLLKNTNYLIVVRNPISRALSAFNWRYKLVVTDGVQKDRFKGEYEILLKYRSLNDLSESLYNNGVLDQTVANEFRTIHHLKEDIAFYLMELLNYISAEQVFSIFTTEFLNEDIENTLGITDIKKVYENRSQTKSSLMVLSEQARNNLRRFLNADYESLERLSKLKELPAHKYQVLMQ